MDRNERLAEFANMKVSRAVLKNVVPSIAGMFMVLLYNLADTFFVSLTKDAMQVAAVSLATPIFMLFMAVGQMLGAGGTSVISRAFGRGEKEYSIKVSAFCCWACVGLGLIFSAIMLIFMNPLLKLVGCSQDTMGFARDYLGIVVYAGPLFLLGHCFSTVIRAEGKPGQAMAGQMIGNVLNIILDPIMILWFNWGISGAAVATVIGNLVGTGYYILYFARGKSALSIHPKYFTVREKVFTSVVAIGLPSALGSIMMSVSQIAVNKLLSGYGDLEIAAYGVTGKLGMVIGLIAIGYGQGVQPLMGFSVGARDYKRFKELIRFTILSSTIVQAAFVGLFYLMTKPFVGLFLSYNEYAFGLGVRFMRIMLSTGIIFTLQFTMLNSLQATGDSIGALILSLSRQGLVFIPAAYLMNYLSGLTGIVWAQPISDFLSTVLSVILYRITVKKAFGDSMRLPAQEQITASDK